MSVARRQFRKDLEQETKRRSKEPSYELTKDEIKDLGVNAGLSRELVEQEFLNLAGNAWAGNIHPIDEPSFLVESPPTKPVPEWVSVTCKLAWFQRRNEWDDS